MPGPANTPAPETVRAPWWHFWARRPRRRWLLLLVPDAILVLLFLVGQVAFGWDRDWIIGEVTGGAQMIGTGLGWLLAVGFCVGLPVGVVLLGTRAVRRRRERAE